MIIPQKYFAVNWADGMKVNKEHFINEENFFVDSLRDMASLPINHYNYGVLPPLNDSDGSQISYEISKTADHQLKIHIMQCQAITPAGVRISISGEGITAHVLSEPGSLSNTSGNDTFLNNNTEHFYIILGVNLFGKAPYGQPDAEEIPIRQPFTQPSYSLQLVRADFNVEQLGGYHLVIGRIARNGDDYSKDNDFIPPCTAIASNEKLMRDRQTVVAVMDELQKSARTIVSKINTQSQKPEIAENLKSLCLIMLDFISRNYFYFKNMIKGEAPVFLISAMSGFANLIHNHLEILTEKDRTDLLGYFAGWSDSAPKSLTDKLEQVIEISYRHHQAGDYMKSIHQMLLLWTKLWQELSRLNYHPQYNANQNPNIIVVTDNVQESAAKRDMGSIIIK